MRKLFWGDLTTKDFEALDRNKTIAVLPIAAIEQHGPHLPVSTDTTIADGMIGALIKQLPDDLSILILPTQAVGKSNEHLKSPGTLTLTWETAIRAWTEIGESVYRAGLRKIILVNSHGGNVDCLAVVARELRVRFGMLVVTTQWSRLGKPPGLYSDVENAVGIHAGDMETSLMLHFRPDLVKMQHAADFVPVTVAMAKEFDILRPTGFSAFAWMAQDLHASGSAGDATKATAEKGRLTAEFQAAEFVKLLRDVTRFSLDRLA